MRDETECRHLPDPVWNPLRCKDCGALLRRGETVNARLLECLGGAKNMLSIALDTIPPECRPAFSLAIKNMGDSIAGFEDAGEAGGVKPPEPVDLFGHLVKCRPFITVGGYLGEYRVNITFRDIKAAHAFYHMLVSGIADKRG
jgi:hypothetical protein